MQPSRPELAAEHSRITGATQSNVNSMETSSARSSAWAWGFAILFLVICVLFVLRRPDAITNPQFWAEDGTLLFKGQMAHGGVEWLFQPYRGYLIVNTKLMALLAAAAPVLYRPFVYNLLAIVISAFACSLFALPTYRSVIRADVLRIAVCTALVGAVYTESLADNLCNSQWYLALTALLILLKDPFEDSKWASGASGLVVCLASLTNPVMVVATPICLWQMLRKRHIAVATALLVGVLIQIIFFLRFPPVPTERATPTTLAFAVTVALIYKVAVSTIAGWRAVIAVSNAPSSLLFYSILASAAAWIVWLFLHLGPKKRIEAGGASYIGLASVVLALNGRSFFRAYSTPTHITEFRGEQYFFIAGCVFLYLLALTAERAFPRHWKYASSVFFCLTIAAGFYNNFEIPPLMDFHWANEARAIQVWTDKRPRALPEICAPINPPGWVVAFPESYPEIQISGFPDHVVATPSGNYVPIQIDPALFRDSGYLDYVYLPMFLGRNDRYHVRAAIETEGSAEVTLMIHGNLDRGILAQTAPVRVTSFAQIDADVLTDPFGRLCFHLTHVSGGAAKFTAITIRHL